MLICGYNSQVLSNEGWGNIFPPALLVLAAGIKTVYQFLPPKKASTATVMPGEG